MKDDQFLFSVSTIPKLQWLSDSASLESGASEVYTSLFSVFQWFKLSEDMINRVTRFFIHFHITRLIFFIRSIHKLYYLAPSTIALNNLLTRLPATDEARPWVTAIPPWEPSSPSEPVKWRWRMESWGRGVDMDQQQSVACPVPNNHEGNPKADDLLARHGELAPQGDSQESFPPRYGRFD